MTTAITAIRASMNTVVRPIPTYMITLDGVPAKARYRRCKIQIRIPLILNYREKYTYLIYIKK